MFPDFQKITIVVRGGGDIASGTIHRLHNCGFKVAILEVEKPSAIRRSVAFSEAIYTGDHTIESVNAVKVDNYKDCTEVWARNEIPIFIDPYAKCISALKPTVVIDAILAKKNLGTTIDMAPITIGLGPGYAAGTDVHAVIETQRGHQLGTIIYNGSAIKNSGIPGEINGYSIDRVIYAQTSGVWSLSQDIGSEVCKGDIIGSIDSQPVAAPISGILRGVLRDNSIIKKHIKLADIDPRKEEKRNCYTISDKARCISGGVLEALLHLSAKMYL